MALFMKRELTRDESIEMLCHGVKDLSPEALREFVRRIWDSLGHEGHEAIKRTFTELSFETRDPYPCDEDGGCGNSECPRCCPHDEYT